jgi:Ca-activated chloride channel family protein
MRRIKFIFIFFGSVLFLMMNYQAARADGIIIPDPPFCGNEICPPHPCPDPGFCQPFSPIVQLDIRYHRVNVTIKNQIAITKVDQVFFNPNNYPVEGTYLFPLPEGAAVSSFSLWIDGKAVKGEILDAEAARKKYEEVVRSMQDPALLEYVDRGAVQASIFPIQPGEERKIELEYVQTLVAEEGLVEYRYLLNTEKFSLSLLEEVAVNVDIRASQPIRAVYSASHEINIDRQNDEHVRVGYEELNVRPDHDFILYYSIGEAQAFHLLTYRDTTDPLDADGFFLLMLAPQPDVQTDEVLPKDVILVLDRSGSMEGEKFHQAQEAMRYILNHINPEDHFNVVTFSTGVEMFSNEMQSAKEVDEALKWVDRLIAQGSTDIERALLEAVSMVDPEKPTYLVFVTDGLPTVGVVDSQEILAQFERSCPKNVRLFAFGVGYDVDTFLLDGLSQGHHGSSDYVLPGVKLDEVLSTFYGRISTPVLTDLQLDFVDIIAYDVYPNPLPDLFKGSQIIVTGRYRHYGETDMKLVGEMNGIPQTFTYPHQLFSQSSAQEGNDSLAALPRIWATRKIGFLLSQVRLNGPDQETIDQIVKLSIRYGVVTPYTSYLVTEPMPLGASEQERIASEQYNQMLEAPSVASSGQQAVEKAMGQGDMAAANAPVAPIESANQIIRFAGSRTFVYSQGKWIDTGFDPNTMQTIPVAFLSDDYFKLSHVYPELGPVLALGKTIIFMVKGKAYEIVENSEVVAPLDLPESSDNTVNEQVEQPQPTAENDNPEVKNTQEAKSGQPASPKFCIGGFMPAAIIGLVMVLNKKKSKNH